MNDGQFDASRRGARREEELDPLPFSAVKMKYWDVQTDLRALCTQNQNHDQSRPESRQQIGRWHRELLSVRLVYAAVALTGGPHVFADAVSTGKFCRGSSIARSQHARKSDNVSFVSELHSKSAVE